MSIYRVVTPGLAINSYVIIDLSTKKAAVIDPSREITEIVRLLTREQASLSAILETHVHADFISGAKELKAHFADSAKIYCSGLGGDEWAPKYADRLVSDRESVSLGNFRLEAWHTPGHTPEHVMWVLYDDLTDNHEPEAAFTGDFLFIGSVGRPDLLGSASLEVLTEKLHHSVFHVLPLLPNSTEVYPAHGAGSLCGKGITGAASSTMGEQRKNNCYLHAQDLASWSKDLMQHMPAAPVYFSIVKGMNVSGPKLLDELLKTERVAIDQLLLHLPKNVVILDVRGIDEFAQGHLKGSLNIPFSPNLVHWASVLLTYRTKLAIVADKEIILQKTKSMLRLIGQEEIMAEALWDYTFQDSASVDVFPLRSPMQTYELMQNQSDVLIVDVRTPAEWSVGHIAGARHIELAAFAQHLNSILKEQTIGLICGSGYRSSVAASILQENGFKNVFNIEGGMQAWAHAGLPVDVEIG